MTLPTREELIAAFRSQPDSMTGRDAAEWAVDCFLARFPHLIREPEREEGWYLVGNSENPTALCWRDGKWRRWLTGSGIDEQRQFVLRRLHDSPVPPADRRITEERFLEIQANATDQESLLHALAAAGAFKDSPHD